MLWKGTLAAGREQCRGQGREPGEENPGEGCWRAVWQQRRGRKLSELEVPVLELTSLGDESDVVCEGKEGAVGTRGFCPEQPERWGLHQEEGACVMPKRCWFWSLTCCG